MFWEQLVNGLAVGSTYALVAVGMALIFGTLRLVTFAHGEVYMFGAYAGFTVLEQLHATPVLAFAAAIVVSALIGTLTELIAFRWMRGASHTSSMLVTIGVSLLLVNASQLIWGPETRSYPILVTNATVEWLGMKFSAVQVAIYAITLVTIGALQWVLLKSRFGRAVRATSLDYEAASVLGVNVDRVYSMTFTLASALGGLSGLLVGLYYNAVYPTMGALTSLKAFSACVLGGLGSVPGAVIAALLLGEAESLTVAYVGSGYRNVLPFLALILVLLFRPQGMFGRKERVR